MTLQVHDIAGGLETVKRKQELQSEIERQVELGGEGLDEQDKYLLEINLERLGTILRRGSLLLAVGNSSRKGGQSTQD